MKETLRVSPPFLPFTVSTWTLFSFVSMLLVHLV